METQSKTEISSKKYLMDTYELLATLFLNWFKIIIDKYDQIVDDLRTELNKMVQDVREKEVEKPFERNHLTSIRVGLILEFKSKRRIYLLCYRVLHIHLFHLTFQ